MNDEANYNPRGGDILGLTVTLVFDYELIKGDIIWSNGQLHTVKKRVEIPDSKGLAVKTIKGDLVFPPQLVSVFNMDADDERC